MSEAETQRWENEFRERLNSLLSRHLEPLASELKELQTSLDAATTKLVERARSLSEQEFGQELAETENHVREQLVRAENAFEGQLAAALHQAGDALKADRAALNAGIAEIDRQRTQAGVLGSLVEATSHFAPRVAFFVVKSGNVIGWKVEGFANGLGNEKIASLAVALGARTMLGDALTGLKSVSQISEVDDEYLSFLGPYLEPRAKHAVAVPLVVRDKAAAVLYADSGAGADLDIHALEMLVRVASMAIELLPLRRSTEVAGAELPQPRILTSSLSSIAPTTEMRAVTTAPFATSVRPAVEQTAWSRAPVEESVPAERWEPLPVSQPEESMAYNAGDRTDPKMEATSWNSFASPREHLNAKRFARFLIGEIRLYQPAKVTEGCRRGDLYDRLKDEIEFRLRLYQKHVPSNVSSQVDYFYHELVNTLAEGDATKLGGNSPWSAM